MSFFRAVIYLLIRSKIYQYIAYQRTAGNQVNVLPPIEAGASCFNETAPRTPKSCGGLHSLHRRRFPCDPRYFMDYVRQISAWLLLEYLWLRFYLGYDDCHI